jgi:pimeloyl-ACP methyl ester carboxylesterase
MAPRNSGNDRVREGWADNRGVRLHYLELADDTAALRPVLFVPGAVQAAERYRSLILSLTPRRTMALSLRGRGRSAVPETGYTLQDHVEDIQAAVDSAGLGRFCIVAQSLGVAYALGYSARHPRRIAGLVLEDYPARHPIFPAGWAERVADAPGQLHPAAARALEAESSALDLWEAVARLEAPIFVLRGMATGSLLSEDHVKLYLQAGPRVRMIEFPAAGHDLTQPDRRRYVRILRSVLNEVDRLTDGR